MSIKIQKVDVGINFTEYCSNIIEKASSQYEKIVFICANRRPIRFIEQKLKIDTALKVDFFTIEEFARFLTITFSKKMPKVHTPIERDIFFLDLIKKIDSLYVKLGNSDAKVFPWAKKISKLFDEIDRQLLENRLSNFQYVEAIEPAKNILENLKNLYKIYKKEYEDFTYNGDFFIKSIPITESDKFQNRYENSCFIFVGTVYLSNSEKRILKNISNKNDIFFIVQDDLQRQDKFTKDNTNYDFETFSVVDRLIKQLKSLSKCEILESAKTNNRTTNIDFYEFSDTHLETSFIAETIKKEIQTTENKKSADNIAVILPQSHALLPLLSYLGKIKDIPLNITMGFPFSYTDFGLFIESLFNVVIDMKRKPKELYTVDSKLLLNLINSPIFSVFKQNKFNISEIKLKIITAKSSIYKFSENNDFFTSVLKPFLDINKMGDFYNAIKLLPDMIDKEILTDNEGYEFTSQVIHYFYTEIANSLEKINSERECNTLLAYYILKELIKDLSLPFEGQPLSGIQIMGMLEARLLSFNKIYFADVNEGILPFGDKIDPLLPESIKKEIGLTSFKEKEMLMKYNFFRLVYSAKNAVICYKSGDNTIEKSTRSRFVEQLILLKEIKEKQKITVNMPKIQTIKSLTKNRENKIKKDKDTVRYFENLNNLSPSSINRYMNCPYQYYLKNVKNIDEQITLDADFEYDKVGTLVHKLLEIHFKKYLNETVNKDIYLKIEKDIVKDIEKLPKGFNYKSEVAEYLGKLNSFQLDALKIILKFRIETFFKNTSYDFKNFTPIYVEKKLENSKLHIYGFADRIDEIQNEQGKIIRIIDYKTGTSTPFPKKNLDSVTIPKTPSNNATYDNTTLNAIRDAFGSIQLPAYIVMAKEKFTEEKVEASIYQIGSYQKNETIKSMSDKDIKIYNLALQYIINHMKNSEYIYAFNGTHCSYCNYNHICRFADNTVI